jgi:hypothetical protein
MTKNSLSVIAQLTLLLALSSAAQAQTAENVTVDFSADQGAVTYRASGFLSGMNSVSPSNSSVTPMKARLFRNDALWAQDTNTYSRVNGLGATAMWILGDSWIQNYGGFNPSGARTVSAGTISNWNAMVAQIVNLARSNGQVYQWDIWNEPDISVFWTGTEAEYQAMWQNAVNTIRGIDSSQVIVGPSTCCNNGWATDLLVFAKANSVLPNIFDVHEFGGPASLISDVASWKTYLAANEPGITLVDNSEIIDQSSTYTAGTVLQYLAAVEHAGVNAVARSCWSTADCAQTAAPNLDGLTNNGLIAAWYAYQAYANITGRLVGVTPTVNVDGVAGQDSTLQQAYSVFGRNATSGTINVTFASISSSASYLTATGSIHVNAFLLQNDNGSGSSGPVQIVNTDYTVSADQISVVIPNLGSNDVTIIQLTPGAGAVSSTTKPKPPGNLTVVVN